MSEGYTRADFAEWADQEGGVYELVAWHGVDIDDLDSSDTEYIEAFKEFKAKALAFKEAELKFAELIGF